MNFNLEQQQAEQEARRKEEEAELEKLNLTDSEREKIQFLRSFSDECVERGIPMILNAQWREEGDDKFFGQYTSIPRIMEKENKTNSFMRDCYEKILKSWVYESTCFGNMSDFYETYKKFVGWVNFNFAILKMKHEKD